MERRPGSGVDMDMKELTQRVASALADHRDDQSFSDAVADWLIAAAATF